MKNCWLVIVMLFAVNVQATTNCSVVTEIPQIECEALVALYDSTDGDNWKSSYGWNITNTPCSWKGVSCDDGHVTELYLSSNQLNGSISPEIGNLTQLMMLDLSSNQLSGSIPLEIWNLIQLKYLPLNDNQLSGSIPYEIGNLTQLKWLSLNNNQLNDPIPSEIWNLVNLEVIYLEDNQLTGSISSRIGNLTQLETLFLSNNQLSGFIPTEIWNLVNLQDLRLSENQLSGFISPEIGNLTQLEWLVLENNQLSGSIPSEIGNLTQLEYLSLNDNQLSGFIPPEIGNLIELRRLYLHNNQLSGSIFTEISNLTKLESLWLMNNQITGSIPTEIGNLNQLERLQLSRNQLRGSIPPEIGNLTQLEQLSLRENQLTGDIPIEIGNLTQLRILGLGNNQLNGSIPTEINNLTQLWLLNLNNNQLSGSIPNGIGNLAKLSELRLNHNKLSGNIPASFTNLKYTISDDVITHRTMNLISNCLTASNSELIDFLKLADPDWNEDQGTDCDFETTTITEPTICQNTTSKLTQSLPNNTDGKNGMTWGRKTHDDILGIDYVSCDGCEAYSGETSCASKLPILCLKKDNLPDPGVHVPDKSPGVMNSNYYYGWTGGHVELTCPIRGDALKGVADANDICEFQFGSGYKMAEHHDGNGGWGWYAYGNIGDSSRFWVSIDDQSSNCWGYGNGISSNRTDIQISELLNCDEKQSIESTSCQLETAEDPVIPITNCSVVTEIPQLECEALLAIYNSTDGSNWKDSYDWNVTNTPCSWNEVTCNDGHITGIEIIPDNGCSHSIYNALEYENDYNTNVSIPSEIADLKQLTHLNLYCNKFIGHIPPEISTLTKLKRLDLSMNKLIGSIPPEIGNLTQLERLDLSYNYLNGSIPSKIGNLTQLERLDLSSNRLSGHIPSEIENLTQLTNIYLYENQLSGSIPPEIGNLTQLYWFRLDENKFSGHIPPEIGNLTKLIYVTLGNNQLSGNIPSEIGDLTQLTYLGLSNNQLSGNIPSEIGDLTRLTELNLAGNQLNGSISKEIGNLTQLIRLGLFGNQLSGSIPPEIGNLTQLTLLFLYENQLSGNIPSEIGNLTYLTRLDLSNNQLSGDIPVSLSNLTNLIDNDEYWVDTNLASNCLTTSEPELIDFLELADPDWNEDQGTACESGNIEPVDEQATPTTVDNETIQLISYQLIIKKQGSGDGTVTSQGINCGTDCVESYYENSTINLTATPDDGFRFVKWVENDCADSIIITEDLECTAIFNKELPSYTLKTPKTGSGKGTVKIEANGCDGKCEADDPINISLTSIPEADSYFSHWQGDCEGSEPEIIITMESNVNCEAVFELTPKSEPPQDELAEPTTKDTKIITFEDQTVELTMLDEVSSINTLGEEITTDAKFVGGISIEGEDFEIEVQPK
ncbi:hypothetical protein QUF74_07495, partial [Candidatus Halobeggiatoa sp. HSG11]|nr:hypothetical protein [Candidatus Halobeggiatoa sp. HSG11]